MPDFAHFYPSNWRSWASAWPSWVRRFSALCRIASRGDSPLRAVSPSQRRAESRFDTWRDCLSPRAPRLL